MTRKSISTNAAVVSCDVCGRTLLRGETANVFLHGGARRMVCELCTARAVHEGWIREGLDDVMARQRADRGRPRSFLGRLRRREERHVGPSSEPQPEPSYVEVLPAADAPPPIQAAPEPAPEYADPEPAVAESLASRPPEPAAPAGPGQSQYTAPVVQAVPTNAELKVARALEVFNASEHPRTVSGVARSLGAPLVSARPSPTEGSIVTIVVAWELSWYRYEVDLGDEAAGVRVAGQGSELSELDAPDQVANAAADDSGRLHPASQVA